MSGNSKRSSKPFSHQEKVAAYPPTDEGQPANKQLKPERVKRIHKIITPESAQ